MMMDELIPGLPEEVARECLVRVSYHLFGVAGSASRLWKRELESATFHRTRRSRLLTRKLAAFVQAEPSVAPAAGPADKYCCAASAPLSYRLSVLDPLAGEWRTLPPAPGQLPRGLPLFCRLAAADRKLIVVGGWDPDTWAVSDAVYVYDFLSGNWRRGARMPGPRRSFFACSAGGGGGGGGATIFVSGGHDEEKNALRSAMAYDVAADKWAPLPDMAVERDECKGAFLNGRFRVAGGYPTERQGQFCKSAETFDVATWEWGAVEEDWLEEATCPATFVADGDEGKFYMVRSGHVVVEECGKWKEVAEVPEDAAVSTQLVTWQGRLLLVGSGSSHGGGRAAYLLEIATDVDGGKKSKLTWHKIELPEEYSGHVQAACCLEI